MAEEWSAVETQIEKQVRLCYLERDLAKQIEKIWRERGWPDPGPMYKYMMEVIFSQPECARIIREITSLR